MTLPALDHLVLDVAHDLDAAASAYRALGFDLTERGHHTLGSSNHLAIFATNYLELLSPGQPGGTIRQELLGFPPGLNGLVFATDDADARYHDLRARGIGVRDPQSFSRPVTLAGGTHDARFRTTHLNREEVPFGRLYFCRHFTRELVWRPAWQRHPNGAQDITALLISADHPDGVATLLTRMFDDTPAGDASSGLRFRAAAATIEIMSHATTAALLGDAMPDAAGRPAFMALMRVKTTSLRQAQDIIGTRGSLRNGRLLVPARAAGNVAIEFEA